MLKTALYATVLMTLAGTPVHTNGLGGDHGKPSPAPPQTIKATSGGAATHGAPQKTSHAPAPKADTHGSRHTTTTTTAKHHDTAVKPTTTTAKSPKVNEHKTTG